MNKLHFTTEVADYEHRGDLDHKVSFIKSICKEATNFDKWEERDYDAENDYADEYGECCEHFYKGCVSFDAPKSCLEKLNKNGYYPD